MKECKVVQMDGKNTSDFANKINDVLRGGWTLQGSFGKNNMFLIFSRTVEITDEEME